MHNDKRKVLERGGVYLLLFLAMNLISSTMLYAGSADAWQAHTAGKNPALEIGFIIGLFLGFVVVAKIIKKLKNRKK